MVTLSFDFIVIGGGSGGIASVRRAASYGAKTLVVESGPLGGTCVNVGCVPKKVMWNAAHVAEQAAMATDYGFKSQLGAFDWSALKQKRDAYIMRLNRIYARNLDNSKVETVFGHAKFVNAKAIEVNDVRYTAEHILIATGGYPWIPTLSGAELGISSDGFFELEQLPESCLVVGAGYIATELAGVLNGLGSEVTLGLRKDKVLRTFDHDLQVILTEQMNESGIEIKTGLSITSLQKIDDGLIKVAGQDEVEIGRYQTVIWAIGRRPNSSNIDLDKAGLSTGDNGFITTDTQQNTAVTGIYAVGDVTGRAALTPVAIAAGRKLADRLFNADAQAKFNYDLIPTVLFTHPPIGTVGLSEKEAIEQFGEDAIKVYKSRFVNMFYALSDHKPPTFVKLVCQGENEKVLGCHIIGDSADEILQGFAVAITMGATKQEFDETLAIHPTAGEELVTLV